jgi:hypothetical protein
MLDPDHVEAIVVCGDDEVARVSAFLAEHRLEVLRISQGVLAEGTASDLERAFGVRLRERTPPLELPVPPALKGAVSSISVLGIAGTHDARGE